MSSYMRLNKHVFGMFFVFNKYLNQGNENKAPLQISYAVSNGCYDFFFYTKSLLHRGVYDFKRLYIKRLYNELPRRKRTGYQ